MTVYANGLEVACKAQANKVIAAFPYVCFTPPQTPATPPGVPVPYPTFGMDSDTVKGTGTVKIGGETVTQKNKSHYSTTKGNEAGCAPKKNVVTSVNTGKEYAHAWSGNVKMDGEPISRFSDLSSNDHASPTAGGPPFPKVGRARVSVVHNSSFKEWAACVELLQQIEDLRNHLQKRHQDMLEDKRGLYKNFRSVRHPVYGSWDGHVQQFRGQQARMRRLLRQAEDMNCTSPRSDDSWAQASRPAPTKPRNA